MPPRQIDPKLSSSGRQSIPLPDKFLCRVCAKWKGNQQFSNKELNKFIYRSSCGSPVTPITAKLRCRGCAGGPVQELECLGPCAETKSVSEFSKAARQKGGSNWCTVCTLWKESSEYSVSVQPPPKSSSETQAHTPSQLNDYEYSDPEAGNQDSDYDDLDHISNLSIAPSNSQNSRTYDYDDMMHRPRQNQNFMIPQHSQASTSIATSDLTEDGSQTSVSNPWENASFSTSTCASSRNPKTSNFNAWDSSGNHHLMSGNDFESTEEVKTQTPKKSKWAKPFGSRNAGKTYRPEQSSNHLQNSDYDSDDLIDL